MVDDLKHRGLLLLRGGGFARQKIARISGQQITNCMDRTRGRCTCLGAKRRWAHESSPFFGKGRHYNTLPNMVRTVCTCPAIVENTGVNSSGSSSCPAAAAK